MSTSPSSVPQESSATTNASSREVGEPPKSPQNAPAPKSPPTPQESTMKPSYVCSTPEGSHNSASQDSPTLFRSPTEVSLAASICRSEENAANRSLDPRRWTVLFLMTGMWAVLYQCVYVPSAVTQPLLEYFDCSKTAYAAMVSATYITGGCTVIFTSILTDRWGTSNTLLGAIICVTLAQILCLVSVLVKSFEMLVISRALFGVCMPYIDACVMSIVGRWFRHDPRLVLAFGILRGGSHAAIMLNFFLIPSIHEAWDLLGVFIFSTVVIGLGIVIAIAFWCIDREEDIVEIRHLRKALYRENNDTTSGFWAEVGEFLSKTRNLPKVFWLHQCTLFFGPPLSIVLISTFGVIMIQDLYAFEYKIASYYTATLSCSAISAGLVLAYIIGRTGRLTRWIIGASLMFMLGITFLLIREIQTPVPGLVALAFAADMYSNSWTALYDITDEELTPLTMAISMVGWNMVFTISGYAMGGLSDGYGWNAVLYYALAYGAVHLVFGVWLQLHTAKTDHRMSWSKTRRLQKTDKKQGSLEMVMEDPGSPEI